MRWSKGTCPFGSPAFSILRCSRRPWLHTACIHNARFSTLHTCCTWKQDGNLVTPIEVWSTDLMFGFGIMKASSTNHSPCLEVDSTNHAARTLNGVACSVPGGFLIIFPLFTFARGRSDDGLLHAASLFLVRSLFSISTTTYLARVLSAFRFHPLLLIQTDRSESITASI
jgi:hypothetical protein